jgi:hypothetical protein
MARHIGGVKLWNQGGEDFDSFLPQPAIKRINLSVLSGGNTSSTASAINGRRDEVQNPEIPEQRKVGMRAIIEGLKNSIRQTFQNVSQGNNSESIENIIKIIYSIS